MTMPNNPPAPEKAPTGYVLVTEGVVQEGDWVSHQLLGTQGLRQIKEPSFYIGYPVDHFSVVVRPPQPEAKSADIAKVLAQLEALRDNTVVFSKSATSVIADKAFRLIESLRHPQPSERELELEKTLDQVLKHLKIADTHTRRIETGNLPHQRGQVLGIIASLIYYVQQVLEREGEDEPMASTNRKATSQPSERDIETMAEAVHDAYLDTCARLGWDVKPENKVPYSVLSEDSKELGRASVRAVLQFVQPSEREFSSKSEERRVMATLKETREINRRLIQALRKIEALDTVKLRNDGISVGDTAITIARKALEREVEEKGITTSRDNSHDPFRK